MAQQLPKLLHDNRLEDATPVASSTAAGYAVANLTDWRPYTWWRPSAMPATVTVDCGSARSADYAALFAHDCATQGNTVEMRGSTDNFSASNVLVATSTPASDLPLVLTFAGVSYRYWRLTLTGGTAPTIAIAAVGAALALPRYLRDFDPLAREAVGVINRSEDGHPLGAVISYQDWRAELSVRNIAWTWLRDTFLAAWNAHLVATPFLLAWDAGDHPTETRLVQSTGKFVSPHRPGGLCDLVVPVRGIA